MEFRPLKDYISSHRKDVDPERLRQAFTLAQRAHADQKRRDGRPYIHHPVEVCLILAKADADEDLLCAALLHDVLEDGADPEILKQEIRENFGHAVWFLVDAMSKDNTISCSTKRQTEFWDQLQNALTVDPGVFFLKLADLLHNLSSVEHLKPEKQQKWMHELREGYIPMLTQFHSQLGLHYQQMYEKMMDTCLQLTQEKSYIT